jgi:hypothetical protein
MSTVGLVPVGFVPVCLAVELPNKREKPKQQD